jgi:host factor-I protein
VADASQVPGSRVCQGGSAPRRRNKKKDRAVAAEKSQNVQEVFLNHVRKSKTPVTIFLVNGVKLQGIITWFDNFSVLLRRDGHTQLVYKHAISTVMPGAPIMLFDPQAAGAAASGAASGAAGSPVGTSAVQNEGGRLTLSRNPETTQAGD